MSNYWSETDKSIEFQYVPNGSIGSLIQKTKEKIQQAISKLGYIPIGKTKIFEHVWDRVLKEIRSTSSWYTFYKGEIEKEKRHLRDIINVHNDIFVDSQKSKYDKFPMLKKLNKQQQMAVYNEEKNTLVVAGAGCGKSTTILGKVAYLIESGKATADCRACVLQYV